MLAKVAATLASALTLVGLDPAYAPARRRYTPDAGKTSGAFGTPGIGCLNPAQRQAFRAARQTRCVYPHEFIGEVC